MKYLVLMYADAAIGPNSSEEESQAAAKTWAEFRAVKIPTVKYGLIEIQPLWSPGS